MQYLIKIKLIYDIHDLHVYFRRIKMESNLFRGKKWSFT